MVVYKNILGFDDLKNVTDKKFVVNCYIPQLIAKVLKN